MTCALHFDPIKLKNRTTDVIFNIKTLHHLPANRKDMGNNSSNSDSESPAKPLVSDPIQDPDGLADDADSLKREGGSLILPDQEGEELKKRLVEHYALLEEAALEYVRNRKETIKILESLADELTTHHSNAQAAKISGGIAGIVGSGLAIGGFAASFFTFGISLGLVAAGAVIGGAGGLTAVGGIMTEVISSKLTSNKAKEVLLQDNNSCNSFVKALKNVEESHTNLLNTLRVSGGLIGGGKNVLNVVNSVTDMVKVSSLSVEAAEGIGRTAFRAASAAGKGVAIASVVLSVVTIPIDLYIIISSAQYLHSKTIPDVARGIYSIIEELDCPTERAIKLGISEMKCRQLKCIV